MAKLNRQFLPTAVCADGTPGVYYTSLNSTSSDYVVYVMGGGGCAHDQSQCDTIGDPSKFGSNELPETMDSYGILSDDIDDNPLFSTFNKVFIHYCTHDMYLLDTVSSDGHIQFRGRPLLEETMSLLFGGLDHDVSVVLAGSSAGGVGAFNMAGWILDSLDRVTKLSVILDSSVLVDSGVYMDDILDLVTDDPSIAYSPSCSQEFKGGSCCTQFICMIMTGQYPIDLLEGTFVIQTTQDALPVTQISEYASPQVEHLWDASIYAGTMDSDIHMLADLFPSSISVFAPSCIDHMILSVGGTDYFRICQRGGTPTGKDSVGVECVYDDLGRVIGVVKSVPLFENNDMVATIMLSIDAWNTMKIWNTSVRSAMNDWWNGMGDSSRQVALFDDCNDINCNPTCLTGITPDKRDQSDGVVVWTVILVVLVISLVAFTIFLLSVSWGLRWATRASRVVTSSLGGDNSRFQTYDEGSGDSLVPVVEWRSLNYWLPKGRAQDQGQQLIYDVNGSVPEGSLCAVMGSSGSGKSTLIDILSGSRGDGTCSGDILFDGRSISSQKIDYISQVGYMRQFHHGYLDELTVLDNLVFATMMRHFGTFEENTKKVQEVIEMTDLAGSLNVRASNLSGGLRRRLSLALELLANRRRILFLDEPTSGLDATGSLELMKMLKNLSRRVTIILSIHQPRQEIWELFSHAIVLKSGRIVFDGIPQEALGCIANAIGSLVSMRGNVDAEAKNTPDIIMDILASVNGDSLFASITSPKVEERVGTSLEIYEKETKCDTINQWKIVSMIMARRWRSGYSDKILFSNTILLVSTLFMAFTLRFSQGVEFSTRLVTSTVISGGLPVHIVYSSVFLGTIQKTWALIQMELRDGIYKPDFAIFAIIVDHAAMCVVSTMVVVMGMFAVFWSDHVDSLPTLPIMVITQIFCASFLCSCVNICLMICIGISGLEYTKVRSVNRIVGSLWSVFSGSVFKIRYIPIPLQVVTYTSPIFWFSSFVLRILLDGSDMSSSCSSNSLAYCFTGYGDVVGAQLDIHMFSTGFSIVILGALATCWLAILIVSISMRSANVDIYYGLGNASSKIGYNWVVQSKCKTVGPRISISDSVGI